MKTRVVCPVCGHEFETEKVVGDKETCPSCNAEFEVPAQPSQPSVALPVVEEEPAPARPPRRKVLGVLAVLGVMVLGVMVLGVMALGWWYFNPAEPPAEPVAETPSILPSDFGVRLVGASATSPGQWMGNLAGVRMKPYDPAGALTRFEAVAPDGTEVVCTIPTPGAYITPANCQ